MHREITGCPYLSLSDVRSRADFGAFLGTPSMTQLDVKGLLAFVCLDSSRDVRRESKRNGWMEGLIPSFHSNGIVSSMHAIGNWTQTHETDKKESPHENPHSNSATFPVHIKRGSVH